ncbi:MAG: ATP-binding protein [Chloroflexi bacterium]|nr:ATP-binding protein [Chloroflexota bacterium]
MVTQVFPGHFSSLSAIAHFVEKQAVDAGLNDDEVYAVQLAVDEACTNIIEHGYGGEGLGEITCSCTPKASGLEIVLTDHGKAFDPGKVPEPKVSGPLEELGSRGAGIYLMKKLMDEVDFEFDEKSGTSLTMFKQKKSQ